MPESFKRAGASCEVFACGHARRFLLDRGVACADFPLATEPEGLLAALSPRLLLAGTSQNPSSPVLGLSDEFKRRKLPTVAFVDMAADADLRFKGLSDAPLKHAPDCLVVVDRTTESAFLNLGFAASRIHVCGHPAYDRVRRHARALAECDLSLLRERVLGSDPSPRPVWLFAAEHGAGDQRLRRSADYTLHGRGGSDERVGIVLEEILDARSSMTPRPFLALRLHPKNTLEEFAHYVPEVDIVSQGGDPLELIWASDLVLGMSSILLMEAALAGRPTLSVVPRECERAWCPSVTDGLTPCVTKRDELRRKLGEKARPIHADPGADAVSKVVDVVLSQLRKSLLG